MYDVNKNMDIWEQRRNHVLKHKVNNSFHVYIHIKLQGESVNYNLSSLTFSLFCWFCFYLRFQTIIMENERLVLLSLTAEGNTLLYSCLSSENEKQRHIKFSIQY